MAKYFIGINKKGDVTDFLELKESLTLETVCKKYARFVCKGSEWRELLDVNMASQIALDKKSYKFDGTNIVKR